MCTVTWLVEPGGYQVFFNRDELRSRQRGLPPSESGEQGVRYLAPTDADAGGTWIAVNEHGLCVCLLNLYQQDSPPPEGRFESRGHLVRQLASVADLAAVEARLARTNTQQLRSFTLLAFAPSGAARLWRWDGSELAARSPRSMPVSSSSYDTEQVLATRRRTWLSTIAGRQPQVQDHLDYHRCELPEPGPYAPAMTRDDALSVSLTRIVVSEKEVSMAYADGPPATTGLAMPIRLRRLSEPRR